MHTLCDIVIFGGHGDLAFRKLMPALYHLSNQQYLHNDSRIITTSHVEMSNEEHIHLVQNKLQEFITNNEYSDEVFQAFALQLEIVHVDFTQETSFSALEKQLKLNLEREKIYYLSTSPHFYGDICKHLASFSLNTMKSRIVLEKPIGRDLESSQHINYQVLKYFQEIQIYRIDHYLGKDTVQNILALRFSNQFFMPLWDANHIDNIQITVAESVGVENRWDYYNEYGAMRDMIQNHLLQLLCLIAMEPPCSLDADSIRDEKLKVLRSLKQMNKDEISLKTVRAQYTEGNVYGEKVPSYVHSAQQSDTETYAALRVDIENWRWHQVPFYLRTGKRMHHRNSEIVIEFKSVPYSIFANGGKCINQNKLVITLQPNESIQLKLMNKSPGLTEQMHLQQVELELNADNDFEHKSDAYERLLLDVIRANATLFMRLDEVEAAWRYCDTILNAWQENIVPMKNYKAGSDGPNAAVELIARDHRSWHDE